MEMLVWIGAAITLAGFFGLLACVWRVQKARRAGLEDEALREEIRKVIPLNMGALFLSVIGLMCVVIGVLLS